MVADAAEGAAKVVAATIPAAAAGKEHAAEAVLASPAKLLPLAMVALADAVSGPADIRYAIPSSVDRFVDAMHAALACGTGATPKAPVKGDELSSHGASTGAPSSPEPDRNKLITANAGGSAVPESPDGAGSTALLHERAAAASPAPFSSAATAAAAAHVVLMAWLCLLSAKAARWKPVLAANSLIPIPMAAGTGAADTPAACGGGEQHDGAGCLLEGWRLAGLHALDDGKLLAPRAEGHAPGEALVAEDVAGPWPSAAAAAAVGVSADPVAVPWLVAAACSLPRAPVWTPWLGSLLSCVTAKGAAGCAEGADALGARAKFAACAGGGCLGPAADLRRTVTLLRGGGSAAAETCASRAPARFPAVASKVPAGRPSFAGGWP